MTDTARHLAALGFRDVRPLGAGGFAEVFAAVDADGTEVALKLARRAGDPRFDREAAALSQLPDDVGPALLGRARVADRPVLVLERVPGGTLRDVLSRGVPARADALRWLHESALRIDRMHRAGVVHRDLKPANIAVCPDGRVALLDFGLASALPADLTPARPAGDDALTGVGAFIGTVSYAAPELFGRAPTAGPAADLYALGAVVFELLTGAPPYTGSRVDVELAHRTRRPPRLSDRIDCGPAADEVIATALAKAPGARFGTASALAQAAERALAVPVRRASGPASTRLRRVALAIVCTDREPTDVVRAVAETTGELVRPVAGGYLVAFPSLGPGRGVRAARRLAAAVDATACTAHVAPLRVVARAARLRLHGAALRDLSWRSERRVAGATTLTAAAHAVVSADGVSAPTRGPGLVGRESLVADVRRALAGGARAATPTLCTIVGAPGMGKTRVLDAVAPAGAVRIDAAAFAAAGAPVLDAVLGDGAGAAPTVHEVGGHARRVRHYAERLRELMRRGPVVLAIDNAHRADLVSLDAIDQCLSQEDELPLSVVIATDEVLWKLRPNWGRVGSVYGLTPLGPSDVRAALQQLVPDVDYVPAAFARAVCERTDGVARAVCELAQALVAECELRGQGAGVALLSAAALDRAGATEIGARLADAMLAPLSPGQRAVAEVVAIAGDPVGVVDVTAISNASSHGDLDAGVVLEQLASRGVLHQVGRAGYAYASTLVRDAVVARLAPSVCLRLHAAALAHGKAAEWDDERIAQHALAAGERDVAARLCVDVGERAADRGRHLRAEQLFSLALEHWAETDDLRQRALAGRAQALFRVSRHDDAAQDVAEALAIARRRRDVQGEAALLLQRAGLLDWARKFDDAAAAASQAAALAAGADNPILRARARFAEGRSAWRRGQCDHAVTAIEQAAGEAARAGDVETLLDAAVTAADAHSRLGAVAVAERWFQRAIALSEHHGDMLHLGAAINNRSGHWLGCGRLDRARADAEHTVAIGRELGYFRVEAAGQCQLAEIALAECQPGAALGHIAEYARTHRRMLGEAPAVEYVQRARAAAAAGDAEALSTSLVAIRALPDDELVDAERAIVAVLALADVQAVEATAWEEPMARARACAAPYEGLVELLWLCGAAAAARRDQAAVDAIAREIRQVAPGAVAWIARADQLRQEVCS